MQTRSRTGGITAAALLATMTAMTVEPAYARQAAPRPRMGEQDLTQDVRLAVANARDRVFPALVNILVVTVSYYGGKESKGEAVGSGTIFSADGLVLTNHHVVDHGKSFKVTLADKQELKATLVGEDPLTDLAVLRLDLSAYKSEHPLAFAKVAEKDDLTVGDYVLAMGSPFALSRTVTLGVVSNTERVFSGQSGDDLADQEFDFDQSSDIFTVWVQHDALINPGNSGGPLVNLRGEVVGVNTRGGAGMAFAVPALLARDIAARITRDGEVIRSTIGTAFKSVKRSGNTEGILINSVNTDGPAAKAGLKAGDVILEMNGKPTTARFPEEIPVVARAIADMPVGTEIDFKIKSDGQTRNVKLTTEKLLREKPDEAAIRTWGFSASQITDKMARNRRLDSTDGAMVFGVRGGGPAEVAEPKLNPGDIVRAVDGKPIKTLGDLVEAYKGVSAKDPLPEFVTIEFERNGKSQLTLIKPKPEKPDDPPREVPKSWIGVATQPVLKDLAKQMGIENQLGFRVTRVYPGTLAEHAGLKVGDIILAVNGDRLQPKGMQSAGDFQRAIRKLPMSQPATLSVLRDKSPVEVSVQLERTRITQEEALRDTNKDFELSVRELTFFDRDDNRWGESVQGVVVVDAERAGWADQAGVNAGDLIQRINATPITDIPSYRKAMEQIGKEQPERVTFQVLRGQRTQLKFAEPAWKPTTAKEPEKK